MSLLYFVIIDKKRSNYTRKVDNLILLTSFYMEIALIFL